MPKRWPPEKEKRLKELVATGKYTYIEIADMMGISKECARTKGQMLGLKNPVYVQRIRKHAHLREPVFRYFLDHSFEEVCEKFNLTRSEVKSVFTVGYKDPKLAKYRKDKRVHSGWTHEQTMFLIHRLGIRERLWIAKKLKRTRNNSYHSVKEHMVRLRVRGKHFHGLASEQAALLFKPEVVRKYSIKTKAGPNPPFRIQLVPWVTLERLAVKHRLDPFWCNAFAAQAKLQRWIYGVSSEQAVRNKIKSFVRKK